MQTNNDLFTIKKIHISYQFCFEFFFKSTCYEKKLQEIGSIFLQNILYKTLFATNFVRNTYEFYNFAGNNYSRKNYLPIKILKKVARKSLSYKFF